MKRVRCLRLTMDRASRIPSLERLVNYVEEVQSQRLSQLSKVVSVKWTGLDQAEPGQESENSIDLELHLITMTRASPQVVQYLAKLPEQS